MTATADRWKSLGTDDPHGPQWHVGQNWQGSKHPCCCSVEELRATVRMDDINYYTRDAGAYRPEILTSPFVRVTPEDAARPYAWPKMSDIALIRLVCAKVLEHRSRGNRHAEAQVLPSVAALSDGWRTRPQHMDAVTYLMANVCPHVAWDGARRPRSLRKKILRELEQPIETWLERSAQWERNRAKAAMRVAKKTGVDAKAHLR